MAKKIKKLSDWEWTLTWSSLRYFCGRYTIASAYYPTDLVKNYGERLSDDQRRSLVEEIERQIDHSKIHGDNMWLNMDMEPWSALRNFLDGTTWRDLVCEGPDIDQTIVTAFPCEYKENEEIRTKWIPAGDYLKSGSTRTSVYEPYIKQIKEINE